MSKFSSVAGLPESTKRSRVPVKSFYGYEPASRKRLARTSGLAFDPSSINMRVAGNFQLVRRLHRASCRSISQKRKRSPTVGSIELRLRKPFAKPPLT